MAKLLMPKATAQWLIEETGLSFDQIAAFTELHPLEIEMMARTEQEKAIRGADPVAAGILTREEIARGEASEAYRLQIQQPRDLGVPERKRSGARFTPVSRRSERPNAVAWLLRNHPEVTDTQLAKLLGTTKATIDAVRNRTHWDSANIKPVDPVTLGLCSQIELDGLVAKANEARAKDEARRRRSEGASLQPAGQAVDNTQD